MPETPTFGCYAKIPHGEMTPERQAGYRSLIETRGPLGGPRLRPSGIAMLLTGAGLWVR